MSRRHNNDDDEDWVPNKRKSKTLSTHKRGSTKEEETHDTDSKSTKVVLRIVPSLLPPKQKSSAKRKMRKKNTGRTSKNSDSVPVKEPEETKIPTVNHRNKSYNGDSAPEIGKDGAIIRINRKRRHAEPNFSVATTSSQAIAPALGMTNFGSNCYANSGIQCLLCIPELNSYFLQEGFVGNLKNEQNIKFCNAIAEVYKKMFDTHKPSKVSPKSMVDLCPPGQNDTHEFFIKKLFPSLSEDAIKTGTSSDHNSSGPHKNGILESLFGGELASKIVCKSCLNESVKCDAFLDISLAICGKTLEECLQEYFTEEELAVREAYMCEKCGTLRNATKNVSIAECPKYLILHLKRLMPGERKIAKFIKFPTDLDMSKFTVKGEGSSYQLLAVCVHSGGGKSGHFFTFGKRSDQVRIFDLNNGPIVVYVQ